jgi:hypothetical protein
MEFNGMAGVAIVAGEGGKSAKAYTAGTAFKEARRRAFPVPPSPYCPAAVSRLFMAT